MSKDVNLTIDGVPVTVPQGTRILDAAKKANIQIPTLCDHHDLNKRALCRICVVECDGGSKLIAACANDVWEGVNVVTNNLRIQETRRTILELILANHPQDCLICIKNKNCNLQSLAESFAIRSIPFERTSSESRPQVIESGTIVRDMDKCIKCGCCVEACQVIQAIGAINTSNRSQDFEICTAYGQALEKGNCAFCGQCVKVCPVGAIYEHDQTAEVRAMLSNSERHVIAQVSPVLTAALNDEFGFDANAVTTGKMIAAIKMLGFKEVFNSDTTAKASRAEQVIELQNRIKSGGNLPLISGCSDGINNFIKNFFPDFTANLSITNNPRRFFPEMIGTFYAAAVDLDKDKITTVSFVPCLAQKYGCENKHDFALTAGELARMIKLAGINITDLPEQTFDHLNLNIPNQGDDYTAERITVYGYAEARKIMETIRSGECDAKWIEILTCPVCVVYGNDYTQAHGRDS